MFQSCSNLARYFLLFLVWTSVSADQAQDPIFESEQQGDPSICPAPDTVELAQNVKDGSKTYLDATVLIGADVLGRIAAAFDYDGDGYADDVKLFVGTTRLTEPAPVTLKQARVVETISGLVVESEDCSLALALSVSGDFKSPEIPNRWRNFSQVVIVDDGIMLARTDPQPVQKRHMSSFDHNSIYSWPLNFHRDMFGQRTSVGGGGP